VKEAVAYVGLCIIDKFANKETDMMTMAAITAAEQYLKVHFPDILFHSPPSAAAPQNNNLHF
jgi:hypothetical protein